MMHIGFNGKVRKCGNLYAVEVSNLLIYSQSKTRDGALKIVNAAVSDLLHEAQAVGFEPQLTSFDKGSQTSFKVYIPANQPAIAFALRQIRGFKAMSLSEAALQMGATSKNSIASYERIGGPDPTIGKLAKFFEIYGVQAQIQLS